MAGIPTTMASSGSKGRGCIECPLELQVREQEMQMMITTCRYCGEVFPAGTSACPNCGVPILDDRGAANPIVSYPTPATPTTAAAANTAQQFKALGALIRQYPGAKRAGLFNFRHRIHCPFCNFEFHPGDCAIYSTTRFDEKKKAILLHPAPQGDFQRLLARSWVRSLDGPEYVREDACRQCPRCSNLLPYRFEVDASFNIAIVGDAFSGKSHYLAALLHQLGNADSEQRGDIRVRFTPLTKATQAKFKEYQEVLFDRLSSLPGTYRFDPSLSEGLVLWNPLIFRLEIGYTIEGQFINNVMNLIFYDISGEDIANPNTMMLFGWPILQSQAIIYFVDPLSIERIVTRLPASPQVEKAKVLIKKGHTSHRILEQVMSIFDRYQRRNPGGKVDTPLALMLSKSDVIDAIAQLDNFQDARFLQNAHYDGTVNIGDLKIVDKEVSNLLKRFGELGLIQESQPFAYVSFFATSATGCAPDAYGKFKEVKPRRCLDPLLWLLWKLTGSDSDVSARPRPN